MGRTKNFAQRSLARGMVTKTVIVLDLETPEDGDDAVLGGPGLEIGSAVNLNSDPLCWLDLSVPSPTDFGDESVAELFDKEARLRDKYDPDLATSSAWRSLQADSYKQSWETGFWDKFFDPCASALDAFGTSLKRPYPVGVPDSSGCDKTPEVERRVMSRTAKVFRFLEHVRDVPEQTWQEEREALWETAIRRWVALIESWSEVEDEAICAIKSAVDFRDKAQILVDIFYNKAPQTLMKRVNSLARIVNGLSYSDQAFPCSEGEFYAFVKSESEAGAPTSRLKAYFEAVVFARHVLGVESLQKIIDSRRCYGACNAKQRSDPRQADPFTVKQMTILHEILRADSEAHAWDRLMAGMLLFCVYARSRWSDAQHAEKLIEDRDTDLILQFIEVKTSVRKTARSLHLRHMFLPLAAPAFGVTDDGWGEQWLEVRRSLGVEDLGSYPLMPAPGADLSPTKRALSTQEAKKWIASLLGPDNMQAGARLTSHSCKATCLSFMAKRGASFEDRLTLGYHSNKLRIAMVYSRDSAARPLALLCHVLNEIRTGVFEPDNTRSGRLKSDAKKLGEIELLQLGQEPSNNRSMDSTGADLTGSNPDPQQVKVPVEPQLDEGHVTTESEDSSDDERCIVKPAVSHHHVPIPEELGMWFNGRTKMFHLAPADRVKILSCGRKITASVTRHTGLIRFDAAKCKQCFRQLKA